MAKGGFEQKSGKVPMDGVGRYESSLARMIERLLELCAEPFDPLPRAVIGSETDEHIGLDGVDLVASVAAEACAVGDFEYPATVRERDVFAREVPTAARAHARCADDGGAARVLEHGREQLRGRSRVAVDQHHERPAPGAARVTMVHG